MSYLASKYQAILVPLAAAIGIGAYALPLISPWSILPALVAMLLAYCQFTSSWHRATWAVASMVATICILLGVASPTVTAAVIIAGILAIAGAYVLSSCILLLHLSSVATLQAILWASFSDFGVEAAVPAVVCVLLLSLTHARNLPLLLTSAVASVLIAIVARYLRVLPEIELAFCAVPACAAAGFLAYANQVNGYAGSRWMVAGAVAVSLSIWATNPPRQIQNVYVLLPPASAEFESKLFENYVEALRYAGIHARRASSLEEIAPGALLILPWLTAALSRGLDDYEQRLAELARRRGWTILAGGEHTDLGGVATRLERMAGRQLLNSDLSVPRGNTDDSGPLHVSDIRSWPLESILNRGASVHVASLLDRVLLAGDGWWVERNLNEWLWVGDYIWNRGDRGGRVPLALAFDNGGARWIVVGDNTSLISAQIIADPRALLRLLDLATLWPAFLADIFIVGAVAGFWFAGRRRSLSFLCIATLTMDGLSLAYNRVTAREAQPWRDTYVGENAFDETNFSDAIAANPDLIAKHRFIRENGEISGSMQLPPEPAVIFLRVGGMLRVDNVTISNCRRVGSLATSEGPYLMDAQACQVDGPARILVGSHKAAAIFSISHDDKTLIVLDKGFLAKNAPPTNATWIRDVLAK
jgi:hypothetical protein